jgi:RHH-type rel operon transcriptional repressor/antitoxin RelB
MPLSLRLPDEVELRLKRLSEHTGRTKTFYVTQAVIAHLNQLEQAYGHDQVHHQLPDPISGVTTV